MEPRRLPPLTPRTMLRVAAWGAATTLIAYLLSGGSIPWFIAWMLVIGITQRLVAYWIVRRRGEHPPPHWWH